MPLVVTVWQNAIGAARRWHSLICRVERERDVGACCSQRCRPGCAWRGYGFRARRPPAPGASRTIPETAPGCPRPKGPSRAVNPCAVQVRLERLQPKTDVGRERELRQDPFLSLISLTLVAEGALSCLAKVLETRPLSFQRPGQAGRRLLRLQRTSGLHAMLQKAR